MDLETAKSLILYVTRQKGDWLLWQNNMTICCKMIPQSF